MHLKIWFIYHISFIHIYIYIHGKKKMQQKQAENTYFSSSRSKKSTFQLDSLAAKKAKNPINGWHFLLVGMFGKSAAFEEILHDFSVCNFV